MRAGCLAISLCIQELTVSTAAAPTASAPQMAVFPGSFSDSVPFLKQPAMLDGTLAGDVGFDPLGFSDIFDVKVLREAELKHGRIAMLAVLGWLVQEQTVLPFFDKVLLPTHTVPAFCIASLGRPVFLCYSHMHLHCNGA
jgi:hypothetical protein